MKRAVFFDVDGTILDSSNRKTEMTKVVASAIRKLQAAGDYVFVATGRPYAFISDYLKDFGFDGFILSNGSQVIMNGEIIYKSPMSPDFVKDMVTIFDERQMTYILEGEYYSYMRKEFVEFYEVFRNMNLHRHMMKDIDILDQIDTYKIQVLCTSPEIIGFCKEIIKDYPEYEYFTSINDVLFEIHDRKNTKATAILKTLEILDIKIEDSYAFGDGDNDIDMLEAVGCGIAMGNASDKVKSYADKITDTVMNDGVAKGIEDFILKINEAEK